MMDYAIRNIWLEYSNGLYNLEKEHLLELQLLESKYKRLRDELSERRVQREEEIKRIRGGS